MGKNVLPFDHCPWLVDHGFWEREDFMDTLKAFMLAEATRGQRPMVFDWVKAATIIKEQKPRLIRAGLRNDWEWTGGTIWTKEGGPDMGSYTYLLSTHAVPEISVDGEIEECYTYNDDWGPRTKWPPKALKLLGE